MQNTDNPAEPFKNGDYISDWFDKVPTEKERGASLILAFIEHLEELGYAIVRPPNTKSFKPAEQIAQDLMIALRCGAENASSPGYQLGLEFSAYCLEGKLKEFASQTTLIEKLQNEIEELNLWKKQALFIWNTLDEYARNHPDIKYAESVSGHALKLMKERDALTPELRAKTEMCDKLADLLKQYGNWEADIIGEDILWWPYSARDVLRGPIYDKMIELQQQRNNLLTEYNTSK